MGSTCFTSIVLALGFMQLEIAVEDKHKTTFRDTHRELWELNRWVDGLKTIPSGFATYVGEALGSFKGRCVQNLPDDIIIYRTDVDGHVEILMKVLS